MNARLALSALLTLAFTLPTPDANAGSVFVRANGGSEGQGLTVYIGQTCYVLTANHVMGGATRAEIVTVDARRLEAEVEKRDEKLDLAILRVSDRTPLEVASCQETKGATLRIPEVLKNPRYASSLVLQRVPSRAGGLDRAVLKLQSAEDDSPWIILRAPTTGAAVAQGDSGATLWNEPGAGASRGGPSNGDFIGMVVSVDRDSAQPAADAALVRVLRSDKMYEATHALFWPVKVDALRLEPANARLTHFGRGRIVEDRPHSPQRSLDWYQGAAIVNMTFDLGDRDTVVSAVTIESERAPLLSKERDIAIRDSMGRLRS